MSHALHRIERHRPAHPREWVPTGELYNDIRGSVDDYVRHLEHEYHGEKFRAVPAHPKHGEN